MREIGVGFGRRAGRAFHEVLREEGRAFGVDLFLHPLEKGNEVTLPVTPGDLGVLRGAVVKLGRVEIAE